MTFEHMSLAIENETPPYREFSTSPVGSLHGEDRHGESVPDALKVQDVQQATKHALSVRLQLRGELTIQGP